MEGGGFVERLKGILLELELYARLIGKAFTRAFRRPLYLKDLALQFNRIGVESLFIVLLTGIFTGMVLALQGVTLLSRFGALSFLGGMIGATIVRELGPVLAALMVAGRVGSSITAELGNMAISEQIEAYTVEGTDVIKKLVIPRFIACLVSLPLLTVLADGLALLGSFLIIGTSTDLNAVFYWRSVTEFLSMRDIVMGLAKPLVFGLLIASIGCHLGLRARGGAEGVGAATKRSVVYSSVAILVSDFFLTKIFLVFF